jgi:hypothetical protein
MDEKLVGEYIDAYRAANPGYPDPKIVHENGWYYVTWGGEPATPQRKSKLIEMRDRLRARVAVETV